MSAMIQTRDGLVRALSRRVRPAIDQAVRRTAEGLADRLSDDEAGLSAASDQRGAGAYRVTVSGPRLFDREFGAIDRAPDPVIGPAIEAVRKVGGEGP